MYIWSGIIASSLILTLSCNTLITIHIFQFVVSWRIHKDLMVTHKLSPCKISLHFCVKERCNYFHNSGTVDWKEVNLNIFHSQVTLHTNVVFELQSIKPVLQNSTAFVENGANGEMVLNGTDKGVSNELCYIHLKGQMLYMEDWQSMVYLATPM